MKENFSIIITGIIGVILIIIVPLISILDRQDDMSYNTALNLTSNFANEVRTKGFIDKDTYYKYLEDMAKTGNMYDYDIEAYKTILIPNVDKISETVDYEQYVEKQLMYNKKEIEDKLEETSEKEQNASNIFTFDVGDEFYIKVKNSNIPSSSLIYRFLFGEGNEKIVNISCGGKVTATQWETYVTEVANVDLPTIKIGIPKNAVSETPTLIKNIPSEFIHSGEAKTTTIGYNYVYYFDMEETKNETITIDVALLNFRCFYDRNGNVIYHLPKDELKDYIRLNNFDANIELKTISGGDFTNTGDIRESGQDRIRNFKIVLTDIETDNYSEDVSITIEPGLGGRRPISEVNDYLSSAKDSESFIIINDYDKHEVEIKGPYLAREYEDEEAKKHMTERETVYRDNDIHIDSLIEPDIVFEIKYQSIHHDGEVIKDAVENNLQLCYDKTSPATCKSLRNARTDGDVAGYEVSYYHSDDKHFGKVIVKFRYVNPIGPNTSLKEKDSKFNYAELPIGWIDGAENYGILNLAGTPDEGKANQASSNKYRVLEDKKEPKADTIPLTKDIDNNFMDAVPETDFWGNTKYMSKDQQVGFRFTPAHNVGGSEYLYDITGHTDTKLLGSGLYKVGIRNQVAGVSDPPWTYIEMVDNQISWKINPGIGTQTTVEVKLIDNIGNESPVSKYTFEIFEPKVEYEIKANPLGLLGIPDVTTEVPENTWQTKGLRITTELKAAYASRYNMNIYINDSRGVTVGYYVKTNITNNVFTYDLTQSGMYQVKANGSATSPYYSSQAAPQKIATYYIDKTKPTITFPTIPATNGWISQSALAGQKIKIKEDHSGIQKVEAYISNSSIKDDSKFIDITSIVVNKEILLTDLENIFGDGSLLGDKYIHVKVMDNVNWETTSKVRYKIDNTGPTVTYTTNSSSVTVTIEDNQSGVDTNYIRYGNTNIEESIPATLTNVASYTVTGNKVRFTVPRSTSEAFTYVYTVDNVGNSTEVYLDTLENPVISVTSAPNATMTTLTGVTTTNLNNARIFTFPSMGRITFDISTISPLSKVYYVVSDTSHGFDYITEDNAGSFTGHFVEIPISLDEDGNTTDMNRRHTLTFNYEGSGTEYSRNITIVVQKVSGQYVVYTIQVVNQNTAIILSVRGESQSRELGDGHLGSIWVLAQNYPVTGDSINMQSVPGGSGTGKFRLTSMTIYNPAKLSLTLQYESSNIFGTSWKNIGTYTPGEDPISFTFEFNRNQRIRLVHGSTVHATLTLT